MRAIIYWNVLLLGFVSCSKEQPVIPPITTISPPQESSALTTADVIYHYQGEAYPLSFKEGSTDDFVVDDNYLAVADWLEGADLVPIIFSNQPQNHIFYFDSEFEGHDYVERHFDALLGRKFKHALRIEELRDQLITTYGLPLNYRNPILYAAAHTGIEEMREELDITSPFPNDIASYIGVPEGSLSNARTPVFTVYDHDNQGGASLNIENGVHTDIWTYGTHNCFTMAAHPDLWTEPRGSGYTWSDCISSRCLQFPVGADGVVTGYYNHANFPKTGCAYLIHLINRRQGDTFATCFNFRDQPFGGQLCGHMNDKLTSIRIKAAWQGCPIDYSNV
ncbi:MAG: hypothetical protein ACRBFS_06710 [Aureispira sp.]